MARRRLLNNDQVETAIKTAHDLGLKYELRLTRDGIVVVYFLTNKNFREYIELCRRLGNHGLGAHEEHFVDEPMDSPEEVLFGEIKVMIQAEITE